MHIEIFLVGSRKYVMCNIHVNYENFITDFSTFNIHVYAYEGQ